jgi:hypothetical protein
MKNRHHSVARLCVGMTVLPPFFRGQNFSTVVKNETITMYYLMSKFGIVFEKAPAPREICPEFTVFCVCSRREIAKNPSASFR